MTHEPVERPVPHSEEAERGVLGSFLLDPTRCIPLAQVQYQLTAKSFYVPAHAKLAGALFDMAKGDVSRIDLLTVGDYLGQHNILDDVGGSTFLEKLIDNTPTSAHVEHYAAIVRAKQIARGVIEKSRDILDEAYTTETPEKLALEASQRYVDVIGEPKDELSNADAMESSITRWEDAKAYREGDASKKPAIGLETPWPQVTSLTCGLEEGLYLLAGRPSAGKTTMEDALSLHVADQLNIPVLRFTLDGTKRKLWDRTLCRYAGVSLPKLKFGFAGKSQIAECRNARAHLKELPIYIFDNLFDIDSICARSRYMKSRYGIGLITIDYIQQLTIHGASRFLSDNANARGEYIARLLKQLWRQLHIPVLALSQLSRGVEKEDRDPKMSDLRDSGAYEQDADVVWFLNVDNKKKQQMEETRRGATKHKRPVWFRQLKHKEAEQGEIPMWLHAPYFRFEVAESDDQGDFADDSLPGDASTTDRDFDKHPELEPQDEGAASAASGRNEEQQEFEPAN